MQGGCICWNPPLVRAFLAFIPPALTEWSQRMVGSFPVATCARPPRLDLRLKSPEDGDVAVVVAPVLRFADVGFNADVKIEVSPVGTLCPSRPRKLQMRLPRPDGAGRVLGLRV